MNPKSTSSKSKKSKERPDSGKATAAGKPPLPTAFELTQIAALLSGKSLAQDASELARRSFQLCEACDQELVDIFPRTEAQKRKGEVPQRWGFLQNVFEAQPDLQQPGVKGTLWGAYNASTRLEDYKQPQQEEQPDQRLERTCFGGGADIKLRALLEGKEVAAKWRN